MLDRGYVEQHEAVVHCIRGAKWNPVDHLANVHDRILIRESADENPERVWTFNVDHYRMADSVWAEVDRALSPNSHGAVHVTVLHGDVGPDRRCENCETVIGSGQGADWMPDWAKPRRGLAQRLGALLGVTK